MIVHSLREAGHAAPGLAVRSQEAEHALSPGHQLRGVEPLLDIARQIGHSGVPPLFQIAPEIALPVLRNFFHFRGAEIEKTVCV